MMMVRRRRMPALFDRKNAIPLTFILIAVNIFAFIILPFTGLKEVLQFTPALAAEMPWTFITSTFMHADISHLLFNMFALFIFGLFLESRLKPQTYLLVYFLAGIAGNVGYMLSVLVGLVPDVTLSNGTVFPAELIPGVGASGAIYGVMGILGAIAPRSPIYMMLLPIPIPMFIAVIIYAVIEIFGFLTPSNIARGAHLGGLVFGVAYGIYLRHQYKRQLRRMNPINISYNY